MRRKSLLAMLAVAPVAALTLSATAAQASTSTSSAQAETVFSNVPDSGYNGGNWATDGFIDTTSVTSHGKDASCPSDSPYAFTATDSDYGVSKTIIGAESPGETAVPIARSVGVQMTGGFTGITFCSSSDRPSAAGVAPKANAATVKGATLAGEVGSQAWYAQFFPHSAVIENFAVAGWSWTYRLPQGPACGFGMQQWIDGATVPVAKSGNIVVLACHV